MSSSKISPIIPLVISVVFIGAALAGVIVSSMGEPAESDDKVAQKTKQKTQVRAPTAPTKEKAPKKDPVAEVEPELNWPLETDRDIAPKITFRLEVQLGRSKF